jgi:general secretion pathway protein G
MTTATMKEKRYARAGFTLMEILIAVMILGLLGALVGPALNNIYKNQQKRACEASLIGLKKSIQIYKDRVLKYPETLKDLIRKPKDEQAAKRWEGPYTGEEGATEVPKDPWGEDFKYKLTPGTKHPYDLFSYGPNGKGSPKDEEIHVWDL